MIVCKANVITHYTRIITPIHRLSGDFYFKRNYPSARRNAIFKFCLVNIYKNLPHKQILVIGYEALLLNLFDKQDKK